MSFDYDVLVIGSGFGGSVAALRPTEKGSRVGGARSRQAMGRRLLPEDQLRRSAFLLVFPTRGCGESSASI